MCVFFFVFVCTQGTTWLTERLNRGRLQARLWLCGVESDYQYNVFGSSAAKRELQLADDTAAVLAAADKVPSWAQSKLSTSAAFIPSDDMIAEAEPSLVNADEGEDK